MPVHLCPRNLHGKLDPRIPAEEDDKARERTLHTESNAPSQMCTRHLEEVKAVSVLLHEDEAHEQEELKMRVCC